MRSLLLSSLFLLLSFSPTMAQSDGSLQPASLWKAGLLGPNIEYETALSSNISLRAEAGLSFSAGYGGHAIGWIFDFGLYAQISPRYFYNMDKRVAAGKNIDNFAGNYFSFTAMGIFDKAFGDESDTNYYILGPTWGIQRNLNKTWYFDIEVGPGIALSKNSSDFVPIIGLDIGIKL
jgi:hypothetical protein